MMMMNQNQSALWAKLASFSLDVPGAMYPFSEKLAQRQNWTGEYSRRAIEEYKKFVFLCFEAGHPCSPSDAVDEVWHLHLTYTVSYWEHMVGKVLPGPLHHEPSLGGELEDAKFTNMYGETLSAYRRMFGTEPPVDIWPAASPHVPPPPSPESSRERERPSARPVRWFVPAFFVTAIGCFLGCQSDAPSYANAANIEATPDYFFIFIALLAFTGIFTVVSVLLRVNSSTKNRRPSPNGPDSGDGEGFDVDLHGIWTGFFQSHSDSSQTSHHDSGSDGGHSGGHGCGGHGCGGHGCGGHGCGSGH